MNHQAATGMAPPSFTQSEINLLQRLAERREEIDAMERELQTREALLQAAERRIGTRIEELKELEGVIKALLAEHSAQEQARIDQLVSIYATMKPKDAARIFNDLDMPILLRVIETMKERSSAAILAEMTPERAKQVTTELARRRALPGSDPMTEDQEAAVR
jgi:flagellar motility protein MotE (MotC chaperone)